MVHLINSNLPMSPTPYGIYSNPGTSWSQIVPTNMPFVDQSIQQQQRLNSNVIEFTAMPNGYSNNNNNLIQNYYPDPCTSQTATEWELLNRFTNTMSSCRTKRRSESEDEDYDTEIKRPVKQCINEEKVARIFNKMHISNNKWNFNNTKIEDVNLEEEEDKDKQSKNELVITDELRKVLNAKTTNVLEKIANDELERHSKAIVLWQPPICKVPEEIKRKCKENNSKDKLNYENSSLELKDDAKLSFDLTNNVFINDLMMDQDYEAMEQ